MEETKGTIIELTEEQKKLMREATGTEHAAFKVEVGTHLSTAPLSAKQSPKLSAKRSAKLSAKRSAKMSAKRSAKLSAKRSAKMSAKSAY